MAKRGRPPNPKNRAQRVEKPRIQPNSTDRGQNVMRGRPPRTRELEKITGHHAKRGRPPKMKDGLKKLVSPLSLCPAPVINPFKDQRPSIEWGERLNEMPGGDSEANNFVFKVKINSEPYVLKVFKFSDAVGNKSDWSDELGDEYPLKKVFGYTDPFYAECRAYGRIKQATDDGEISGKIAVKCHGYIFLNRNDQEWLEDQGIDLGTENLNDELLPFMGGAGRPRALVKDFEMAGPDLNEQTPQQIRKMFRRVWILNKLGIYNTDVKADNFRNGWLVDFDTSYTLPHDVYNVLPRFEREETQAGDVAMFENMLEEAGINMKFLATKNFNFRPRLKMPRYEGTLRVD